MITTLTQTPLNHKTPLKVSYFLHQLTNANKPNTVCDLGAGIGNLSYFYKDNNQTAVTAVEIDSNKTNCGKKILPKVEWINQNCFSRHFIEYHLRNNKFYDTVYCNPTFSKTFASILVALIISKCNPQANIYFILPNDFFETTQKRFIKYQSLNFIITDQWGIGRNNYFHELNNGQRKNSDSIFKIKYAIRNTNKYNYTKHAPYFL